MGRRNTAPPSASASIAIEDSESSRAFRDLQCHGNSRNVTGTLGIFYRDGRGRWCGVAPAHCCWGRPDGVPCQLEAQVRAHVAYAGVSTHAVCEGYPGNSASAVLLLEAERLVSNLHKCRRDTTRCVSCMHAWWCGVL
eukprot:1181343-Prorocentrum_minimum.AAC.2